MKRCTMYCRLLGFFSFVVLVGRSPQLCIGSLQCGSVLHKSAVSSNDLK